MKRLNVLFGFKTEKTAESIVRSISMMGYSVNSTVREKLQEMKNYIKDHPELDAVILKEYLDGGGELGTEELIDLADDNKVNFVVVLDAKKRGQDSMKDLYAAGILNAYFSDGKTGANADKLASLAVSGRTHKEAREYYRIDRGRTDHRYMSYYEFKDLYRYLISNERGINMADRFVSLTRWIDEEQLAFFIKTLPKQTKDELCKFEEFVDINNSLYRKHLVDYRYRLSDAVPGITPENVAHKMVEEHIGRKGMDLSPEPVAVNSSEKNAASEEDRALPVEERTGDDIYVYAARMSAKNPVKASEESKDSVEASSANGQEEYSVDRNEQSNPGSDTDGGMDEGVLSAERIERTVSIGKTMDLVPGNGNRQEDGDTKENSVSPKKKGLFYALKKKLFDPEKGVVTISETPVSLDDIPDAMGNDEFSVGKTEEDALMDMRVSEADDGPVGGDAWMEDMPVRHNSATGQGDEALMGEADRSQPTELIERENEKLKERLRLLEDTLSAERQEQREIKRLLKKAMEQKPFAGSADVNMGNANSKPTDMRGSGTVSACIPEPQKNKSNVVHADKQVMAAGVSETPEKRGDRPDKPTVKVGKEPANKGKNIKPLEGNTVTPVLKDDQATKKNAMDAEHKHSRNVYDNKKENTTVHNKKKNKQTFKGQSSIDDLINEWAN